MMKRIAGLIAIVALGAGAGALAGCPTEVSEDNIQRCCICLTDESCLNEGTTTADCREEITGDGTTDYDLDCQLDACFNECDFL